VTFADEHAQQKAVEEMNGREVEGRAISVKVAIDKPKEEKESDNPSGSIATNGAAPAS
jgi:RNA recognition motif-containing protein